jgi:T5SS/PEP-CTERM-associated repeat protein
VQSGFPFDLDVVPDSNDTTNFDRGSTYAVTISSAATVDRLLMGTDRVSFTGSPLTTDSTNTTETGRGLVLGFGTSDAAVIDTYLGSFSTVYATIGSAATAGGTFRVHAGTFNVTGSATAVTELIIGRQGTGTISVSSGADANIAGDTHLGEYAGSAGTISVSGAGSTWTNAGAVFDTGFTVGQVGTGTLTISSDADVTSEISVIGAMNTAVGTANVDGGGATWTTDGLTVGSLGTGTLNVTTGGRVSPVSATIASGTSSTGTVNVNGSESKLTTNGGLLTVGISGTGTLNVSSGGLVENGNANLGFVSGSNGTATISDVGSTWTSAGDLYVGNGGTGTLNVLSGGRTNSIDSYVGYQSGSTGTATVSDGESRWSSSGEVVIGYEGAGTVHVLAGGRVTSTGQPLSLGDQADGHGTLNVDGTGSTVSVGAATIGRAGTGQVNITGGGELRASSIVRIGFLEGSTGSVLVSGSGSRLQSGNAVVVGEIGDNGTGTLTVTDGGVVEASFPVLGIHVTDQGSVHGDGTLLGDVTNDGLVSPGLSTAALNIDGDYQQRSPGELLIELASVSDFDQLLVTGAATLAGTLEVTLLDGFAPYGEYFLPILTASSVINEFGTELLPSLVNVSFDVIYNPTDVVLHIVAPVLPGDYNGDGKVGAGDYPVWRNMKGEVGAALPADGTGPAGVPDGVVDNFDYAFWKLHYGDSLPSQGLGSTETSQPHAAVPEPATLTLIVYGLLGLVAGRRQVAVRRVGARTSLRVFQPSGFGLKMARRPR